MDLSFFPESFPVIDLDQLLRGHRHQSDFPGQLVNSAFFLQRRREPEERRALGRMSAGVSVSVYIFRMIRTDQRVQFPHDEERRPGPAGIKIRVKTGNISRLRQLVPEFSELLRKIGVCLPLAVAGFGMCPDIPERVFDERPVFVNMVFDPVHHLPPYKDPVFFRNASTWFL